MTCIHRVLVGGRAESASVESGMLAQGQPLSRVTELQALVRESTPMRLAVGLWEFL